MRILASSLVCLVMLVGCGQQDTAPPSPDPETGDSAPAEKQMVVGIVSPAMTSMFHVMLLEGAEDEGRKLGWQVESLAPDRETNFAAQVNMVEALVRRKVDAISICAINVNAIVGAIEKANQAGIPVFVHNSLTELTGCEVEAYIGYNQRKAGFLCGEYAAKLLKKRHGTHKGKVYILLGIPGFHTTERAGGFVAALKPYPEIEVVAQTPANWERQQAMNVASAGLKASPDIDLFFGCSDAMAQGAAQAAIEAGKDVFTIGIDGNPDTLKDVRNGVVTATCSVYPAEMGRITIRTIAKVFDNDATEFKVETPIKIIDQSNVDQLTKTSSEAAPSE